MNKRYLVKFSPIEPFFFGEEKNFDFNNFENKKTLSVDNNNYFIKSGKMPTQSTIIGVLRFFVLKNNGSGTEVDEKGIYSGDKLVGEKSFNLSGNNEFGSIKKIGPVHLFDGEKEYFRIPHNFKKDNQPMEMEVCGYFNGHDFLLPKQDEYDPKVGLVYGFMSADGNNYYKDTEIFGSVVKTRILKDTSENSARENGFFKKEFCYFRGKNWFFCCEVEVEDIVDAFKRTDIIQMGQDKSSFYVTADEIVGDSSTVDDYMKIIKKKNEGSCPEGYAVKYAVSDIYFTEDYYDKVAYAITAQRDYRFMTTDTNAKSYYARLKKSSLYHLVNAGSVFFTKDQELSGYDTELEKWGFNSIL